MKRKILGKGDVLSDRVVHVGLEWFDHVFKELRIAGGFGVGSAWVWGGFG